MTAYYEIDSKNTIRVFNPELPQHPAPVLLQPTWPNGTKWASKAQAEEWAQLYVDTLNDPTLLAQPGVGPEEPVITLSAPVAEEPVGDPQFDPETGEPINI